MGGSLSSKGKANACDDWGDRGWQRERIRTLEIEVNEMQQKRLQDKRKHRQQAAMFAAEEAEWKRERKQLQEQIEWVRSCHCSAGQNEENGEEEEEMKRGMVREVVSEGIEKEKDKEWQLVGANFLVEHMREEHARKAEAVEKWKRLYLAIKTELDALISRTSLPTCNSGSAGEEEIERLKRELKMKEEIVERLRAQLTAMEKEGAKREMEVDILRQSLRIMSNSKKKPITKSLSRSLNI